jgi:HEAT repeat protein
VRLSLSLFLTLLFALPAAAQVVPREGYEAALRMRNAEPAQLLADVGSRTARVRRAALLELARRRLPEGLPVMLGALKDIDRRVRAGAVEAVARLGTPEAREAAPALAPLLQDSNVDVRRQVAVAFEAFKLNHGDVTGALVRALGDRESRVRLHCAAALGYARASARQLFPILSRLIREDRDQSVVRSAVSSLMRLGFAAEVRVLLETMVAGNVPSERQRAVYGLGAIGPPALPLLWKKLDDRFLAPKAKLALKSFVLGRYLLDLRTTRRSVLVGARFQRLQQMRRKDPKTLAHAVLPLGELVLFAASPAARRGAVRALADLKRRALPAAKKLGEALSDPIVADPALDALFVIGPEAVQAAMGGLIDALETTGDSFQVKVIRVIASGGHTTGNPGLEALISSLEWGADGVRLEAAKGLLRWRARAKPALPSLCECARTDTSRAVRLAAIDCLRSMGRAGKAAIPVLKEIRDGTKDKGIRIAIALALLGIGGR